MSAQAKPRSTVTPGGDRRTVMMTVELPGGRVRTLVAESQRRLAFRCVKLYGRPVRLLSLSTPTSILADIQGSPDPPPIRPCLAAIFDETPRRGHYDSRRDPTERAALKAEQRKLDG